MKIRGYLLALCLSLLSIAHADTESALAAVDKSIRQRNYQQAVTLLKPLIQQNNAIAQFRMAGLYRAGKGVKKDMELAIALYEKAAISGHGKAQQALDSLLKRQQKNADTNRFSRVQLFDAVSNNNIALIRQAIARSMNLNISDQYKRSLLHLATGKGFVDIARLLLSQGVNINAQDTLGNSALMIAIQRDHKTLVKLLLSHKADPNLRNLKKQSAIELARNLNAKNSLAVLKEAGFKTDTLAKTNITVNRQVFETAIQQSASLYPGWPLLSIASQLGEKQIADQLMQQQANVNAADPEGFTALHRAASKGHLDIVKTLISRGVSINALNRNNESALYLAASEGRYKTTQYLLGRGAKTSTIASNKSSALSIAISSQHEKTASLLVNKPLDKLSRHNALMLAIQQKMQTIAMKLVDVDKLLDQVDQKKRGALWYSVDLGLNRLVDKLLKARPKININQVDINGYSALGRAAIRGNPAIAESLVKHGANIQTNTNQGNSLLMLSVLSGEPDMVKYFIKSQIDLNLRNKAGDTALMLAAAAGNHGITRQLIQAGADLKIRNQDNQNAYQIALNAEHLITAELIKTHSGALFNLFN